MKCFYHKSDLDGHCSGAIIKQKYPECEMIGVDYNDTIRGIVFDSDETVFVVDFSFDREEMLSLHRSCRLVWIDHHKTAIEKMTPEDATIDGLRVVGKAGCELTWEYLYEEEMPRSVKLLGRYDVWDHSDPSTLPFQYGMRQFSNTLPDSDIWMSILNAGCITVGEIIKTGKTILDYQNKQNAMYAKGMSYEAEFEGHRAIVMNKAYANSQAFDSVYDPEKHDIMVLFGVKPGELKYSLYSVKPEVDVSVIAKKYGGGGHKGAAGFFIDRQVV